MRKYIKRTVVIFACSFLLIACQSADENTTANESNEQAVNESEQQMDDNNVAVEENTDSTQEAEESDVNAEEASVSESQENKSDDNTSYARKETTESLNLPAPIEIYEEVHDAGVVFTLEEIHFEDDHILVSFSGENTRGHAVELASEGRAKGDKLGGITLQDDTGYNYRYLADVNDHRIQVFDQERVSGTVSFVGKIKDDANSLTIIFNPGEGSDRKPEFAFENIPINR